MKHLFEVPDGLYLLSHSVGCMPKATEAVIAKNLAQWQTLGGDAWPAWLEGIAEFKQSLARLLGGQESEYCPQTNLSSGLSKYLLSKPVEKRKNTVLMHASAFPSMGFVVQCMQQAGYQLELIDEKLPTTDINIWQSHLSDRVGFLLVTHVHSNSGELSPVAELCEMAKAKNIVTLVDVAQSAGVVPLRLGHWQADVVLGSCIKWLCGGPGAGFMWINPQHLAELKPMDVGWFSHQAPFEFDIRHFEYAQGADRFWGGTPSVLPYTIAANSITMLANQGIEQIWQHNQILRTQVLQGVGDLLQAEIKLENTGGTLCLPFNRNECDAVDSVLKQEQARFDRRGNTIRLSLHIYNDLDDADKLVQIVREALVKN